MKTLLALCLIAIISTTAWATVIASVDAGPKTADAGALVLDAGHAVIADAGAVFAPVLPTPDDAGSFVSSLVDATKGGHWRIVGALVIMAAVWGARKWGSKFVPWFKSRWGGVSLALGLGVAAQFITQLCGAEPMNTKFIINGLVQGALASGFWSLIKNTTQGNPEKPVVAPEPTSGGPSFPAA